MTLSPAARIAHHFVYSGWIDDEETAEQFLEDVRLYLIQAKWCEQIGDHEEAEQYRQAAVRSLTNAIEEAGNGR